MWRIVEPVLGHDVARDALSSAMGTLATYLGNGRSYAAYELFGGSRSVHDVDAYLGRDRTRMLVADVLELGASVESGYMGDVTSAMAHLAGTLAGLGVELDRSRVCRHAMRLLAQPPRRYHSRSSAIMSWATCIEQQVYVRGLDVAGAPGQHHGVLEYLEAFGDERLAGSCFAGDQHILRHACLSLVGEDGPNMLKALFDGVPPQKKVLRPFCRARTAPE